MKPNDRLEVLIKKHEANSENLFRKMGKLTYEQCDAQSLHKEYQCRTQFITDLKTLRADASPCCGADMVKFTTYGYNECVKCGKTFKQAKTTEQ